MKGNKTIKIWIISATVFLFLTNMLSSQTTTSTTTSTTENSNVTSENTEKEGKIKLTTRRTVRRSRIQELQEIQKKRKGTDIFGLGLIGFTGGFHSGSLKGAKNAGAPSDDFNGYGMGALFVIEFANGEMNSIGFKSSGKWYWRWGLRVQLDFTRRKDKTDGLLERQVNELLASGIVYYYFPMEEFSFSKKIVVLNRVHFFLGAGMMSSVGIQDTIENLDTRTVLKGPTQSDMFIAVSTGFNLRLTEDTYLTFDYRLGINLTGDISDPISGKTIADTGSGMMHSIQTGIAYAF